jgi:hypothetical protein
MSNSGTETFDHDSSRAESADQMHTRYRRRVINATCTLHGGTPGFTNLVLRKVHQHIELTPHATGACVIMINEPNAKALVMTIAEWLELEW